MLRIFILEKYLKLEGKWKVSSASQERHSSLIEGKRFCKVHSHCFGLKVAPDAPSVAYSMQFPIELKLTDDFEDSWLIHRKDKLIGILIIP